MRNHRQAPQRRATVAIAVLALLGGVHEAHAQARVPGDEEKVRELKIEDSSRLHWQRGRAAHSYQYWTTLRVVVGHGVGTSDSYFNYINPGEVLFPIWRRLDVPGNFNWWPDQFGYFLTNRWFSIPPAEIRGATFSNRFSFAVSAKTDTNGFSDQDTTTAEYSVTLQVNDLDIGAQTVRFADDTTKPYSTGIVSWRAAPQLPLIPDVIYEAYVQDHGWLPPVQNGTTAGTTQESRRLEAMKIQLSGAVPPGVRICYSAYVQGSSIWKPETCDGAPVGTTGEGRRMEAIKIRLLNTTEFGVMYAAHVQGKGWLPIAKDGQPAGTTGEARRMEALEVVLYRK